MAKDPAFLFYSSDFLTGTMVMSFEDRGKYITLLALMHQQGRMDEETIRLLVGSFSDKLKSKFSIDEKGLYYNERLEEESEKRKKFTESRRNNGSKGGRPKNKKKPKKNLSVTHKGNLMEDVNEDVIIIKNNDVNECYENCLKFFSENLHPETNKIKNEWLDTIEKLNRIDNIPFNVIEEIVKMTRQNDFWSRNFLSISKLRKKNKDGIKFITVFYEQFKHKEKKWEYDHWFTEDEKELIKQDNEIKRITTISN